MKRSLIHLAAMVLLVAACIAIWHWRFVIEPGVLPETRLSDPLVGWKSRASQTHQIETQNGKPVLILERASTAEKTEGVHVWFDDLQNIEYIHIRCTARWQDVELGNQTFMKARMAAFMKDSSGNKSHPAGGCEVFAGWGNSEWKSFEVVQELTSDMQAYGLAIEMLGNSGRLEVRDLSIHAVRQRGWIPAATAFIVLGWIGLCFSLIRSHPTGPSRGRSLAGATVLVISAWFLVFPQTKVFLRPLPHHFAVGQTMPSAESSAQDPSSPISNRTTRDLPNRASSETPRFPVPAEQKAKNETRDSGAFHRFLREIDKRFGPAHVVLFTGFTLIFFAATGRGSLWPFPLTLAMLAEVIPELTDHLGGWDDWVDLASNLAGVGIAVLLWSRLPILRRLHNPPASKNS
ncbi:hypothetical protein [Haloferula sp.]|uniref:hypothetical protein n=1 Tax=Haloferula sp. TaxID=2497595 RepID=UPI003C73E4A0